MCHVSLLGDRGCPHENVEEQEQGRYLERERERERRLEFGISGVGVLVYIFEYKHIYRIHGTNSIYTYNEWLIL